MTGSDVPPTQPCGDALRLLAAGRTADVYLLADDRVLRRYRNGSSGAHEAAVMAHVGAHGYPVPEVFSASGADIVMQRIRGSHLGEALLAGRLSLDEAVRIQADLLARLHTLPARTANHPTDRVLHLDLHAENIMMSRHGPVVIDWGNATEGPPGYDIAVSALIMAEVAVDAAHPYCRVVTEALPRFLRLTGVPAPDMIARAADLRMANPTLSAEEKTRLKAATALIR